MTPLKKAVHLMSGTISPQRSRVTIYWRVWLAIVAFALLLRFTVFLRASSDQRFSLAITYALCTWVPVMILNVVEGRRLMVYLKSHHRQKWEELTYVPGFGSGGQNSFRAVPWLYSPDDLGDPAVAIMKADHRRFIRLMLTVFFSFLVLMPLLGA